MEKKEREKGAKVNGDRGGSGYTGEKSKEEKRGGRERGASKQTLRSFIFLAIIFFREKNPSPFHFVFISVVNAS